jgi:hypothetical protein
MRVTIIPSDQTIGIDGRFLRFEFSAPANVHAIQWLGDRGEMEFEDGTPNRPLTAADYEAEVKPFVDAWREEAERIDNPPPPTEEEARAARVAEIKARLDKVDLALIRGLDSRDEGTATEEDEAKLAELRAEKRALRAELKTLEVENG